MAMELLWVTAGFWLALAISTPKRPPNMDETLWLVYRRLMGGRERLSITGLILTMITFFALILVWIQHT